MTTDRFTNFMNGFSAANQLLSRAAENGYFIEYICLATSVVDGFLRTATILRYQLDNKTSEIPEDILFQSDEDKIISEREIYRRTLNSSIIPQSLFDHLDQLYKLRNKVVHRYVISEITTKQVIDIAYEYEQLISQVSSVVKRLEDEQLQLGIGMTKSGKDIPPEVRATGRAQIQRMADEKHGNLPLAQKLKSADGTNGA